MEHKIKANTNFEADAVELFRPVAQIRDRQFVLPNFIFGKPETEEQIFYAILPFSSLVGWIYEGESIVRAERIFPMGRLQSIRTLSLLSRTLEASPNPLIALEQPQTRYAHSLLVARTLEAIMRANSFEEKDINIAIAAALLHDIATPALGDATKKVDEEHLHEEKFWKEMLDDGSRKYLEQISATEDQIDDIINNRGIIGQLLDISDRISYTMTDLLRSGVNDMEGFRDDLGDIFQDVRVDHETQEVYFEDPQRLGDFLKVRSWLFENVYIDPKNQGADFVFAKLLKPLYTSDPNDKSVNLTPHTLRTMKDQELIDYLTKKYQNDPNSPFANPALWFPLSKRFDKYEDAQSEADNISSNPNYELLGIGLNQEFNPSTKYRIKSESGEIIEYRQAYPEIAAQIERVSQAANSVSVYYRSV